jgi:hypothetical protein
MTNLTHLQNALNKVVNDVKHSTLEDFVRYLTEHQMAVNTTNTEELKTIIEDYLKNSTTNVFTFVPKKKEKKSRPPNSYNLFIKDKMREIKEANPEYKGKELMKKATEAWNQQKSLDTTTE